MLQWREMGGNQDRLEHISYPTILIVFFCWAHWIQKLFMKCFTDGCLFASKMQTAQPDGLTSGSSTEKSSCMFKQLLPVAELKQRMVTRDSSINVICKWYLFPCFWQAPAFWWKQFGMFECLIITTAMETYRLIACTGTGKPKRS